VIDPSVISINQTTFCMTPYLLLRGAWNLPGAVSGGLVRDLPGTLDPEQIVKVDPTIGFVRDGVEAEQMNRPTAPLLGGIAHFSKLSEIKFL
jgi:hypothetical protein